MIKEEQREGSHSSYITEMSNDDESLPSVVEIVTQRDIEQHIERMHEIVARL